MNKCKVHLIPSPMIAESDLPILIVSYRQMADIVEGTFELECYTSLSLSDSELKDTGFKIKMTVEKVLEENEG